MKLIRPLKYIFAGVITLIIGLILVDNYVNVSEIRVKGRKDYLRVGYVNLNKSRVSKEDITKIESYDCDIWLFAEWNGGNFELKESFDNHYINSFELVDTSTYGFYVLTINKIKANEFGSGKRPYACDYSKIIIDHDKLKIAFIHAPPPVPTCNFETGKYLTDLMD